MHTWTLSVDACAVRGGGDVDATVSAAGSNDLANSCIAWCADGGLVLDVRLVVCWPSSRTLAAHHF